MSDEQFQQHAHYPRHYQRKDAETTERKEKDTAMTDNASRKLPPTCLLLSQIDALIELCSLGI
jgi:hypothetical protein